MRTDETRTVKLTVDNRTVIRVLAVGGLFLVGLNVISALALVIKLIIMAAFLAIALNPPVTYLTGRMTKGRRSLATAISYIFVILVISLFLAIMIPPFVRETSNFIDDLPSYIDNVRHGDNFAASLIESLNLDEAVGDLSNNITEVASSANSILINGINAVGSFIFQLVTVLVLAFFMLIEGPGWSKFFWETQKPKFRARYEPLMQRVYKIITTYVNGQLFIALIAGFTSLVAMLIAGIPYPLPLAASVAMLALIPLVGATIGAVLVVFFALLESVASAVFMAVFFLVYQQIENNAIQPYVQSKNLELSPLLVLVAVLVGATLGGLIGAFIAIPVAASIRIFYIDYHDQRMARNKKAKA